MRAQIQNRITSTLLTATIAILGALIIYTLSLGIYNFIMAQGVPGGPGTQSTDKGPIIFDMVLRLSSQRTFYVPAEGASNQFKLNALSSYQGLISDLLNKATSMNIQDLNTASQLATLLSSAQPDPVSHLPNQADIARAQETVRLSVAAKITEADGKEAFPKALEFLGASGSSGPPGRGDDGGGGGGGGDTGGGGTGGTGGTVTCRTISNVPLAGDPDVGFFSDSPSQYLDIFTDLFSGVYQTPLVRNTRAPIDGIPTMDVGPLLHVTLKKQVPLLRDICNAVSGLAADIKAIRVAAESIDATTKKILVEAIGIHQDTTDLKVKEYILDPEARAAAEAAIDAEKIKFEEALLRGRPTGTVFSSGAKERSQFTPEINKYADQMRKDTAFLFYFQLEKYFKDEDPKNPYKDRILKTYAEKLEQELNKNHVTFREFSGLASLSTLDDMALYLDDTWSRKINNAYNNAISEYIAGNTLIGSKACPEGYLIGSDLKPNFKLCANDLVITTPAPVVKNLVEKFGTTKLTQAELADERGEIAKVTGISDIISAGIIPKGGGGNPPPPGTPPPPPGTPPPPPGTPPPPPGDGDRQAKIEECVALAIKPFVDNGINLSADSLAAFRRGCELQNPPPINPIFVPPPPPPSGPTTLNSSTARTNLAGVGSIFGNTSNNQGLSLKTETAENVGQQKTILTFLVTDQQNPSSCIATSDWPTYPKIGGDVSYIFRVGDIIPTPTKDKPQIFTITHPQLFSIEAGVVEPEVVTLNNKTPGKQNIISSITQSNVDLTQTSFYALNLSGVETEDLIYVSINNTTISVPASNLNPIDIVRRLITEATSGRSDIRKALSEYNFSQEGSILKISTRKPVTSSIPEIATYSIECNVADKLVPASVKLVFP